MTTWQWEDETDTAYPATTYDEWDFASAGTEMILAAFQSPPASQQVTTKIPPGYSGSTLWFTYEEQVQEWADLTELTPERQGPALRSRLEGAAAIYKNFLDRQQLARDGGVEYFLRTLRPHFVKGASSVFLWRFMQIFRFHRSNHDMLQWLGKITVLKKRVEEAWMDLCNVNVPDADAVFQQMVQAAQAAAHAAAVQAGTDPNVAAAAVDIEAVRRARIEIIRQAHRERFPLSENLFALIMIVLADLNETQRERLMTAMSLKNIELQTINPETVRTLFMDLFCTPASALDPCTSQHNHHDRTASSTMETLKATQASGSKTMKHTKRASCRTPRMCSGYLMTTQMRGKFAVFQEDD